MVTVSNDRREAARIAETVGSHHDGLVGDVRVEGLPADAQTVTLQTDVLGAFADRAEALGETVEVDVHRFERVDGDGSEHQLVARAGPDSDRAVVAFCLVEPENRGGSA